MQLKLILVLVCALGTQLIEAQFSRAPSVRCLNPNQRSGICVSIYDCQTVMSVLQRTPLQPLDVEFVKASECAGEYGNGPFVCCASDTGFSRQRRQQQPPPPQQRQQIFNGQPIWGEPPQRTVLFPTNNNFGFTSPPSVPAPPQRGFFNGPQGGRVPAPTAIEPATSLIPVLPTCGGVTIENKIYGGSDADLYEFPWMVLFEYNRKAGDVSINCAGSLINQRYVLTAAHCMKGAIEKQIGQLIAIRLGEHDTTSQVDCSQYSCAPEAQRVGIEQLIPHELYKDNAPNKEHDIGLVRLDRNIRFSDTIRPICLPSAVSPDKARSSSQFTVAGWGRTLRASKSPVKQKLNVALVDQEQCRSKFRGRKVNIVDTQLCAGGKFAEDSCEGDSGGPLMRFRGGAWVLEGIVSFGFKCGLKDWPAVHTRVESYDSWIRSNVRA